MKFFAATFALIASAGAVERDDQYPLNLDEMYPNKVSLYANDWNKYKDCGDFDCSKSADAEVKAYCESISETDDDKCSDGIDNDKNGFTDCQDFSCCKNNPNVTVCNPC